MFPRPDALPIALAIASLSAIAAVILAVLDSEDGTKRIVARRLMQIAVAAATAALALLLGDLK